MSELTVGSLSGLAANSYVIDVASGSQLTQPGMVLQVVQAVKTDVFTTASTTYATITGLSASITPSSTNSKILILASVSGGVGQNTGNGAHLRLSGGNTAGYIGDAAGSRTQSVFSNRPASDFRFDATMYGQTMVFLDSPATTSSTTYEAQIRTGTAGTVFVNRAGTDNDDASHGRGVSTITLMEIAG